uniref:Peptidase M14 domain-containing protein n=1 Tax=Oreochromis aureus TaxID=47969 RepID=A0A668SIK8_OREAU
YMIKKGGSEALLTALVKYGHTFSPNYTILIPLLHLLAKVGHKDRRIGMKAEEAGAVLLTLNLLKHNGQHARRTAACLWVIQVFCSSGTQYSCFCHQLGVKFISWGLTLKIIMAAISLNSNPNITFILNPTLHIVSQSTLLLNSSLTRKASALNGYISGLLWLYEDWHSKDTQDVAIAIRHALLCCLLKATDSTAGRQAFLSQGGIRLLYQTAQCLVEPSVQLMRKCLPRIPLPVTSDQSAYSFLLPGTPAFPDVITLTYRFSLVYICVVDESSDESDAEDDDLETDLNKLRLPPDPDRPKELLTQYSCFCPELSHDFQVCTSPLALFRLEKHYINALTVTTILSAIFNNYMYFQVLKSLTSFLFNFRGEASPCQREDEQDNEGDGTEEFYHHTIIDRLLERHGAGIPHHDPKLYCALASKTKSIPEFSILAFPDFWGHLPPPGHQPMAPRKPNIQRQKVFEDIQRFLKTDDIINHVVFDLEDSNLQFQSDSLRFFSKFESGNLRKAVQVRRYEYDLILNPDVNSSQHTQWFYFEVSNMTADVPYRFNVINCEKSNSQFNYGMQPVLYSVKEALEGRPHWIRTGTEICYFRNNFCPAQGRRRTTFYTLTFTITFKHSEDVCYLAYHYPYTYSVLMAHLKILQKSVDPAKVFFKQQTLCSTLAGNSCPIVTITACPVSRRWKDLHQLRNRPYIVLTSRVHPGESNASWVMKGTLEFLCSNDLLAQSLREAFVFKVIPMLNPDGVINGTNRCDLNSKDLNRQWSKPDPLLSPTIYHTKGFLYYLNIIGRTPVVFCDYHGHSRKKNVFLYGCSIKETLWQSGSAVDTVGLKEDPGYRTIPKTLDRIAPTFSFNSCNFLVEKSRSATARVVVWREMGVLRSYTMENTYNGCNQGIYKVCVCMVISQRLRCLACLAALGSMPSSFNNRP